MNFTFENQGTNTYLVYQIAEGDELDTMSLGMLTNNEIPGLVPVTFTQVDNDRFIKYNVSARVSATQLFTGPVSRKRLLGVISGIVNAMLVAEDYMLEAESLLLDKDYIFADVSTGEAQMICLPVINREQKGPGLSEFLKDILFHTQFDTNESSDHVVRLLNYLNSVPVISLTDLRDLLEKLQNGASGKPGYTPTSRTEQDKTFMQKQIEKDRRNNAATVRPAAPQPVAPQPVTPQPVIPQPVIPQPVVPQSVIPQPVKEDKGRKPGKDKGKNKNKKADKGEKQMSWFYLMQHYSKENAAIYKQQQEAKKNTGAAPASPVPGKKPAPGGFAVPGQPSGFAIPGQPSGFAVPGQPSGFAVPGQPSGFTVPGAPKAPEAPAVAPSRHSTPVPGAEAAPVINLIQPQPSTSISFGETTVLGSATGETTVLGGPAAPAAVSPHLIRKKDGSRIPVDKPVFRIGKERSYVDYFISDNTAISRSHASIIARDGEFFIVDTNSTNHTYVNGTMIPSNLETPLTHGCRVCLANEEFEFYQY